MSDLTATGCGCGTSTNNGCGCNSIIWIILLLSCCGGCGGTSLFGSNDSGCGCEIIWILLLLSFCGNGSVFNNGCGCGC